MYCSAAFKGPCIHDSLFDTKTRQYLPRVKAVDKRVHRQLVASACCPKKLPNCCVLAVDVCAALSEIQFQMHAQMAVYVQSF